MAARILSWASRMADVFQEWLADHELVYTISSIDGVTAVLQGGPDTATLTAETIDVDATMNLGSPCAKDILTFDFFSEMIQEVFAHILSINISIIKVGSLEAAAATAIHFSINATGGDHSIIKKPNSASQMKTSVQHEFISRNLSCTIQLMDGMNPSVSQNRPDASALMTETVKVERRSSTPRAVLVWPITHSSRLLL